MKGERLCEETLPCSLCCSSHEGPGGSAGPESVTHGLLCPREGEVGLHHPLLWIKEASMMG